MTQIQAAAKVGISNGTLSGYERNYREPDMRTLRRLAELYGVSIDYLLTGREFTSRPPQDGERVDWSKIPEHPDDSLTEDEIAFLRGCLALFRTYASSRRT